jgi:hypothetical protein
MEFRIVVLGNICLPRNFIDRRNGMVVFPSPLIPRLPLVTAVVGSTRLVTCDAPSGDIWAALRLLCGAHVGAAY